MNKSPYKIFNRIVTASLVLLAMAGLLIFSSTIDSQTAIAQEPAPPLPLPQQHEYNIDHETVIEIVPLMNDGAYAVSYSGNQVKVFYLLPDGSNLAVGWIDLDHSPIQIVVSAYNTTLWVTASDRNKTIAGNYFLPSPAMAFKQSSVSLPLINK